MILNTKHFNRAMPVGKQLSEASRIRAAHDGDILFEVCSSNNTDVIETLLYRTHTIYYKTVGGTMVRFIKGSPSSSKISWV